MNTTRDRLADASARSRSLDAFLSALMDFYDALPKSARNAIILGDIDEAIVQVQNTDSPSHARTNTASA